MKNGRMGPLFIGNYIFFHESTNNNRNRENKLKMYEIKIYSQWNSEGVRKKYIYIMYVWVIMITGGLSMVRFLFQLIFFHISMNKRIRKKLSKLWIGWPSDGALWKRIN